MVLLSGTGKVWMYPGRVSNRYTCAGIRRSGEKGKTGTLLPLPLSCFREAMYNSPQCRRLSSSSSSHPLTRSHPASNAFSILLNYDTMLRGTDVLVGVLISFSISILLPSFDFDLLLRVGIFSVIFLERAVPPSSQCDSSTS